MTLRWALFLCFFASTAFRSESCLMKWSYCLRFPRTANRVLAHFGGEREVYDSALGSISLFLRIHGVQSDVPTGHHFHRPVAGRPNPTERRRTKQAPGWRPTIDPGRKTWAAGP